MVPSVTVTVLFFFLNIQIEKLYKQGKWNFYHAKMTNSPMYTKKNYKFTNCQFLLKMRVLSLKMIG